MCTYIIHPVLVTFMYTCHHWFCQVVHNSHFHASTYPNICITFHIHYSIRVLLVSIQWSIVNEHGHNTHTMHMVRDRFRLLDAIVDPPSSFSDLIHVYHYKRYPICCWSWKIPWDFEWYAEIGWHWQGYFGPWLIGGVKDKEKHRWFV